MPDPRIDMDINAGQAPSLENGGMSSPGTIPLNANEQRVQSLVNGPQEICSLSKQDFLFLIKAVKRGDISVDDLRKILRKLYREGKVDGDDLIEILSGRGKSCAGKGFEDLLKLLEKVDLIKCVSKILSAVAKSLGFLNSDSEEETRDRIPFQLLDALLNQKGIGAPGFYSEKKEADIRAKGGGENTQLKDSSSDDPLSIIGKAVSEAVKKADEKNENNKNGTLLFKSDAEKRLLEELASLYPDQIKRLNPQHQYGTLSRSALVAELEKMKHEDTIKVS